MKLPFKSNLYFWIFAVAVTVIVGSAWVGLLLSETPTKGSMSDEYSADIRSLKGYQLKDNVEDFTLKNIDNKDVSLNFYSNQKGVIIVFTCNHCPFAKAYEDRIIALDKKFRPLGYPVIAINPTDAATYPEDAFEKMQERAASKFYPFAYLSDQSQQVARRFGAVKTPHAFILKRTDKQFLVEYIGTIDDNPQDPSAVTKRYIEDAVNALLSNKSIPVTTTKAIGCVIKWKDK